MTTQQRINLLFQVADGECIGRRLIALDERGFQFLDFRLLSGGEIAPPQLETRVLDFLQDVAQLAGGAFGGGSRIVQLMRESRGQLTESGQSVSLLFDASGFADPVGHQANQTLGQLRHLLNQIRKSRGGKSCDAAVGD